MWAEYGTDEKKYQAKYRSLFSNLKDELNQGLRNALFTGDLQVTKLIQMSHEVRLFLGQQFFSLEDFHKFSY